MEIYKTPALVLIAILANVNAGAIAFTRCPDIETTGDLYNVIVPSCSAPPCVFHKGQSYSLELDFENNRNTTTLTPRVYGIINGIQLPWVGINPDGCQEMVIGSCPLYMYDYVTYGVTMKVEAVYPVVDATLKWIIEGDDGKAIFCFLLPVYVRD